VFNYSRNSKDYWFQDGGIQKTSYVCTFLNNVSLEAERVHFTVVNFKCCTRVSMTFETFRMFSHNQVSKSVYKHTRAFNCWELFIASSSFRMWEFVIRDTVSWFQDGGIQKTSYVCTFLNNVSLEAERVHFMSYV
jgi:hypothetical protein